MPTKFFQVDLEAQNLELHKKTYTAYMNKKTNEMKEINKTLINSILSSQLNIVPGKKQGFDNNFSLKELTIAVTYDNESNISSINTGYGEINFSDLAEESKAKLNNLIIPNANNNNENLEETENSTRVYIKDNYIAILKPSVIFKKDNGENLTTMVDSSLSNSNCYIQDCKVPDEGRQIINKNPKSDKIIVDIITDEDDNLIRLESTFGNIDANDLSEKSKEVLQHYLNKIKPNKLKEQSFDISYDGTSVEFHYGEAFYKFTINSEGCIFHVLNKYNPHQYDPIAPDSVPPEVKRLADNFLKQKNPDIDYNQEINNISDALNNDELWSANGKQLSSVPTKLSKIINSDNYNSPQEKYSALINEAKHQQNQKRSLATRWFKPRERPAQVTKLLNNIVEGKDIDINELEELAESNKKTIDKKNEYNNKEVENITNKYKSELKAQQGNADMLYGSDEVKNDLFTL